MSERLRRPYLKHPFEAKHVIVASCAAIAMVLGAMSVGQPLRGDRKASPAAASSITTTSKASPSATLRSTGLTRQHTLEVRSFLQQQSTPPYNSRQSTTPTPSRKSLAPVFGASDNLRFIDHMVQLQQPPVTLPVEADDTGEAPSGSPQTNPDDSGKPDTQEPTPTPDTPGETETPGSEAEPDITSSEATTDSSQTTSQT